MNMSAQCDYMMISIIRIMKVPSIADLRQFIDQWIIISKVFENVGRSPCVINLYVDCGVATDNLML